MKDDDLVTWAMPANAEERGDRFRVLEVRGDRVLVEDASSYYDNRIAPTFVYLVSELVVC